MKCMARGHTNIEATPAKFSEYVLELLDRPVDDNIPLNLCHCKSCGFAFFDYRYNIAEVSLVYADYRGERYQTLRHKYDKLYTERLNDAIGNSPVQLRNRKAHINRVCSMYINKDIAYLPVLDYGGDMGQYIPQCFESSERFVFEISGKKSIEGVSLISDYNGCLEKSPFAYIMCNHVLEHFSNIDEEVNKVRNLGDENTVFYFEVPFDSPFYSGVLDNLQFLVNPYYSNIQLMKTFFKKQSDKAPRMNEHINYFTPEALVELLTGNGFAIIEKGVRKTNCGYRKANVIYTVCKIAS